tara:strand:- start:1620 stop:1817 length:198 start_codon:yes stop_codon:yes gene_type:complete
MNKQQYLDSANLNTLRSKGVISQEEVAYWAGDILVAENVITSQKRAIHEGAQLLRESSNPTLLKG